ncbi:hypothetical protein EDD86DRAFT_612 [Gorgonomyces haynaldii]|nr:hypothetical protein EDD86DRAFT_612 [Gorgonomyces haynaldii]
MGRESMRQNYQQGVDKYYGEHGSQYRNPHYPDLLRTVACVMDYLSPHLQPQEHYTGQLMQPEASNVLHMMDLACGSGEATLAIQQWVSRQDKFKGLSVVAMDPFTADAFKERTGLDCRTDSFLDVSNGLDVKVQVIVCSFALHLAPESLLYSLFMALGEATQYFVILSPHKKPIIKDPVSFELVHQGIENRIHFRIFKSIFAAE